MEPDCVADVACDTGENPLWHPDDELLYWCDIPAGHLFRYDPVDETHEKVYRAGRAIGGFTIHEDGSLLLFESGGRIERWNSGDVETVLHRIPDEGDSRFNDVIADPEGRVFAGTMPTDDHLGRLYRIDVDGSYEVVDEGFEIPNGMAFTDDLDTLYVAESDAHTIHQYDYERSTGKLSSRRPVNHSEGLAGVPDGLTIDSNGDIWCARWNGCALDQYSGDGALIGRIDFPVRKVSSVTFGGVDFRDIYVTTAGGKNRREEGERAGSLFRVDADVRGREEFRCRIGV